MVSGPIISDNVSGTGAPESYNEPARKQSIIPSDAVSALSGNRSSNMSRIFSSKQSLRPAYRSPEGKLKDAMKKADDYETKMKSRVKYLAQEEQKILKKIERTRSEAQRMEKLREDRLKYQLQLVREQRQVEETVDNSKLVDRGRRERIQAERLQSAFNEFKKKEAEREKEKAYFADLKKQSE